MFKNSVASGEIDPDLWGRSDLAQFQAGAELLQNFLPGLSGMGQRRAGFLFNGLQKNTATASRAIAYVRSRYDANCVELADNVTRIWKIDGTPVMSGGSPYEIASPYAAADLAGLRWCQLGNVLLFFHADGRQPRRLQKVSENSWNWATYSFEDGPWQAENADTSKTISATDWRKGQTVTLSASFSAFAEGMEGTQIRLRNSRGLPGVLSWKADEDPWGFAIRLSNGRVYYATDGVSSAHTGNTPPSHDFGSASDGQVDWGYLHDNSGVVQITGVTNATTATGLIIRNLPTTGTDISGHGLESDPSAVLAFPPTFVWAFSSYSDYFGWPTAWPCIKAERLIVGGGRSSPDTYDGSQVAGYYADKATFTPGLGTGLVLDDDAIQGFCGDESHEAQWFLSQSMLICGTHGGETAIVGQSSEAAPVPAASSVKLISGNGSADGVRPIKAQDTVLYVVRGGKTLRSLTVSPYDFPGASEDLSFIGGHIARRGLAEIEYTTGPDYTVWARLADKGLAALVYNREQGLKGWARQALGGGFLVDSLCVLPDDEGNDRLWVFASRTKDDTPQRVVMMLSKRASMIRCDAAVRYVGAAAGSLPGLDHLEGEEVLLMAGDGLGGYAQYRVTVDSGVATLPDGITAVELVAGVPYLSRFVSLPATSNDGLGKWYRIIDCNVAFNGVDFRAGTTVNGWQDAQDDRDFGDTLFIYPRNLVARLNIAGDSELDPRLVIECDSGFDFKIKAINATMERGQ